MSQKDWGWDVSALLYEKTYGPLSHQLDEDVFSFLGDRLRGAVVVDSGSGPGVVTRKFAERGAAKVFAIDGSAAMLRRVPRHPAIELVHGRVEPSLLLNLARR